MKEKKKDDNGCQYMQRGPIQILSVIIYSGANPAKEEDGDRRPGDGEK